MENRTGHIDKKSARHYSLDLKYTSYKHYHKHSHISHDVSKGEKVISKGPKKTFIPMKYPDFRNVETFVKTLIPQIKKYQKEMESMFKSGVNPYSNVHFDREDVDFEWVLVESPKAEYLGLAYIRKGARGFHYTMHSHIYLHVRDTKGRITRALSLFEELGAELGYRTAR